MAHLPDFVQLLATLNIADNAAQAKATYMSNSFGDIDTLKRSGHIFPKLSWPGFTDVDVIRICAWCDLQKEEQAREQARRQAKTWLVL